MVNRRTNTRLKEEGKGSTRATTPRLEFSLNTNKSK